MADAIAFVTTPSGTEAPVVAAPAAALPSADRPAWLPENFKSVEDYAKSLGDTKAELTRAQQELAKFKKPADPAAPAKPEGEKDPLAIPDEKSKEDEAAKKVADAAGVDFAPYTDEFVKTGDVAEESRAKIAESLKSIFKDDARAIVDDYIDGKKASALNARSQITGVAGGEEGYTAMCQWAATNLSAEDKAVYNKQINSSDFHTAMFAAQGLKARYEAKVGRSPKLVTGDGIPADTGGAFTNLHDMKAAIADPRYSTDPNYRKSVEQRVMKSNL